MRTIVSETATAHGWGSDPWKRERWVSGLSGEEREHVRNGTARVIVTGCPPAGGGTGTRVRMVVNAGRYSNGFTHRLPDAQCEGVE